MAYNELGIRIGGAGHDAAAIVAAAVQAGHPVHDAPELFKDVLRSVFDSLNALEEAEGGVKPAAAPADERPRNSGGFQPRILGKKAYDDIPDWLGPAMQAVGATAVFDNRKDRDGNDVRFVEPPRPWFKTPPDPREGPANKGFWPPK